MKKKVLLLSFLPLICSCSKVSGEYPYGKSYAPNFGEDRQYHIYDDDFKLDGVLNEGNYGLVRHFIAHETVGDNWADIDAVMYFGYEGVFIGVDITENTLLYCNPFRATYINSGVEMYLTKAGQTTYGTPYTMEIDMVADGTLNVKKNIGYSSYGAAAAEDEITPILATKQKQFTEPGIYGYTHELFISYDYFRKIGFSTQDEDVTKLYADFCHITSNNYEGTDSGVDRYYYSFCSKQYDAGGAFGDPRKTLNFTMDDGLVAYDINIDVEGEGKVKEKFGRDFCIPKNSCTFLLIPENIPDGEEALDPTDYISAVKINNKNRLSSVKTTSERGVFSVTVAVDDVISDLNVEVEFK